MDHTVIQHLETSFKLLAPRGPELVDRFYAKLFATHPAVRPMFPKVMTAQKQKLLASIKLVIENVRKPENLREPLIDLGRRHQQYGTLEEHYPVVRDTLLNVMSEMAGSAWHEDLRAAWTEALNVVAGIMIEGQRAEAANPTVKI
jgi:hemoglobin-like flavoprotein